MSHTATCNHFTVDPGYSMSVASISGKCERRCKHGHTSVPLFKACIAPVRWVRYTIEDIADAFVELLAAIEDLPVVSEILGAFESILLPLMEVFENVLGVLPSLPSLPEFDLDKIFPSSLFDGISLELPEIPDVSKILDKPEKFIGSALEKTPFYNKDCGTDPTCYYDELGIEDTLKELIDP